MARRSLNVFAAIGSTAIATVGAPGAGVVVPPRPTNPSRCAIGAGGHA
jgi:hypothetical protein